MEKIDREIEESHGGESARGNESKRKSGCTFIISGTTKLQRNE